MSKTSVSTWKEKLAAAAGPSQTDDAVEQAFMQQAYVAIANRDKALMSDPYMLGFEIIEKNDDNNRLVGVFAFRCNGEILMVPVFFLNGKIKGASLLYRKGVNRIVPNTEEWVSYLMSREEDKHGSPVKQDAQLRNTPMQLHLDRMTYPGGGSLKTASEGDSPEGWKAPWSDLEPGDIGKLWKEAAVDMPEKELEYLFADAIAEHKPLRKLACTLVERSQAFANMIARGNLLEHRKIVKKAKEEPKPGLVLRRRPNKEKTAADEFYKKGYEIEEVNGAESVFDVILNPEEQLKSGASPGIGHLLLDGGGSVKVLSGEIFFPNYSNCSCAGEVPVYPCCINEKRWYHLLLDGADKGTVLESCGSGGNCPVSVEKDELDDKGEDLGDKPKSGKAYLIWLKDKKAFYNSPIYVKNVSRKDGVVILNDDRTAMWGNDRRVIIRDDLDESDFSGDNVFVLGKDAALLEVDHNGSTTGGDDPVNIHLKEPSAKIVTQDNLEKYLVKQKYASCLCGFDETVSRYWVKSAGAEIDDLDRIQLVLKFARDLGVSVADAELIADEAFKKETPIWFLKKPEKAAAAPVDADGSELEKSAAARWLHEDYGFDPEGFDSDLRVPISYPDDDEAFIESYRSRWHPRNPRWGDAHDPGKGIKELGYIPDEMIMSMMSPAQEMSQIGSQLGLGQLVDHGALSSMLKTYDVKPYIEEYIGKLEESLDCLGRLLFVLYWKPRSFGEMYGIDDMPNMENKISGVFMNYGDLILELLQSNKEQKNL